MVYEGYEIEAEPNGSEVQLSRDGSSHNYPPPTLCSSEPTVELCAVHSLSSSIVGELEQHLDVATATAALVIGQVPQPLVDQLAALSLSVDLLPYGESSSESQTFTTAEQPAVACLEGDFETIDLDGSSYDLILVLNSWNQMMQGMRSAKAARLLRWGGGLIACWSEASLTDPSLGHELHRTLRNEKDCFETDCGAHRLWGDPALGRGERDFEELRSSALFSKVDEFVLAREWDCDRDEFLSLLQHVAATTNGSERLIDPIERGRVDSFFSDHGLSSLSLQCVTKAVVALL